MWTAISGLLFLIAAASAGVFFSGPEAVGETLIRQSQPGSCGAAALATLINAYPETPGDFSEADVFAWLSAAGVPVAELAAGPGFSLAHLAQAAGVAGFQSVAIAIDTVMLGQLQRPALAFLPRPRPHFTVIRPDPEQPGWLQLLDPSLGRMALPVDAVARLWADEAGRGILMLLGQRVTAVPG